MAVGNSMARQAARGLFFQERGHVRLSATSRRGSPARALISIFARIAAMFQASSPLGDVCLRVAAPRNSSGAIHASSRGSPHAIASRLSVQRPFPNGYATFRLPTLARTSGGRSAITCP